MDVLLEYRLARIAVDRLKDDATRTPDIFIRGSNSRRYLRSLDGNLEGTDLVRLFAAFEAALRSDDRAKHNDPNRMIDASILIDQIGGRRGQGIRGDIREGAREVRRVRNFWAHESDQDPGPMTIGEARSRLQTYLAELPDDWG